MSVYNIQALQTSPSDATVLLNRASTNFNLWPRVSVKAVLPAKRELYRTGRVIFTTPTVTTANGVETSGDNAIMDVTFKFPRYMLESEISAFVVESLKVLNHADVVASLKTQIRLSKDITTT